MWGWQYMDFYIPLTASPRYSSSPLCVAMGDAVRRSERVTVPSPASSPRVIIPHAAGGVDDLVGTQHSLFRRGDETAALRQAPRVSFRKGRHGRGWARDPLGWLWGQHGCSHP